MSNIITATFCSEQTRAWTDELWQYDYGQILQFAGLELPNAYEVHFANQPHGVDSITQIGNADGVTIPDEFLLSGECVYAWVYLHTGVDDGETEYMVTIPVSKRAKPTHEEPTPVQQAEIEQAIAALNTAVNEAETAIEHYPKIEDGTWRVWDVTNEEWVDTGIEAQGEDGYSPSASVSKSGDTATITITDKAGTSTAQVSDGEDGYSPELSAESITGGHRVSMTDASGTETFDVMDGLDGDDGYSPSASVSKDGHTTTISVTDKSGTTTAQVLDGTDGDDGYSPQLTISDIQGGHRITITDATGTKYVDVMDGEQGDPGPGVPAGGQDGDILRKNGNDDFSSYWGRETVTDVKVDGTTILDADGVADIPRATNSVAGVVIVDPNYGVTMATTDPRKIAVRAATSTQLKAGTNNSVFIDATMAGYTSFYGLAKVAGSDEKNSSLPVGQYTDAAKIAIQKMLGIYEAPWELIREDTFTNAEVTYHDVSVDSNGQPFELTDIRIVFYTPQQETEVVVKEYGRVMCYFAPGTADVLYIGAYTQAAGASTRISNLVIEQKNGLIERRFTINSVSGNNVIFYGNNAAAEGANSIWQLTKKVYTKIRFESVKGTANYRIYGRRNWS